MRPDSLYYPCTLSPLSRAYSFRVVAASTSEAKAAFSSDSLRCTPPPLGWRAGAYAQPPRVALTVCWRGFDEPHSAVVKYEVAFGREHAELVMPAGGISAQLVTRAVAPGVARLLAQAAWDNLTHVPGGVASAAELHCLELASSLDAAATYVVRVAATNLAGLRSGWATTAVVADTYTLAVEPWLTVTLRRAGERIGRGGPSGGEEPGRVALESAPSPQVVPAQPSAHTHSAIGCPAAGDRS